MIVGIIDHAGQAHCLEHASTVSSWSHEVHDYSSSTYTCWCGDDLHAPEAVASMAVIECLTCCAPSSLCDHDQRTPASSRRTSSAPEVEPDVIDELDYEEDELLIEQHERFIASAFTLPVPVCGCLRDCEECGQHVETKMVRWFEPNRHDDGYARICTSCQESAL
jgi:hypothetical protein